MKSHLSILLLLVSSFMSFAASVVDTGSEFLLFNRKQMVEICIDSSDFDVVGIAANMLASDIKCISGRSPKIIYDSAGAKKNLILAGTLGHSSIIDHLIADEVIDVAELEGKWETYKIVHLEKNNGFRKGETVVIVGSDRRATAYGLLALSDAMGISPWIWWSDVEPEPKESFSLLCTNPWIDGPDVKYRGLFINDERYGLHSWAKHTFDRELMDIGPKTYEKVFELMLRLKANYCWPAMHDCTTPFNEYPENREIADKYAIVMGSSHCEQMLRNNTREWHSESMGPWNYLTNREKMLKYWSERIETNGQYENIYTLGLRGLVDTEMYGANTVQARVEVTDNVMKDQRNLLASGTDSPISEIPQLLCLYKEVQEVYENGLNVPDDITLMWVDDNHGYIRRLPDEKQCNRKGGAGIYYHLSYHGDPESWLWLSSISPSLINYEMGRAFDAGVRTVWMANVGDIKPHEKELSFFMDMAWNRNRWTFDNIAQYNELWARKMFGEILAEPVAHVLDQFYSMAASGKPEHVKYVDYSLDEMENRCQKALSLIHEVEDLESNVPERLKNAFFELVEYPAKGASLMNIYYLKARISMVCAQKDIREKALFYSEESAEAERQLDILTEEYHRLNGGKWNKLMTWRNWRELDHDFHWPRANVDLIEKCFRRPSPKLISVDNSDTCVCFSSNSSGASSVWINAVSSFNGWTTYNVKKVNGGDEFPGFYDDVICEMSINGQKRTAHVQPIGNAWHATSVGPLWSKVGEFNIIKGENIIELHKLASGTQLCSIYIGEVPPPANPLSAHVEVAKYTSLDDGLALIPSLSYSGAVARKAGVSESLEQMPSATYRLPVKKGLNEIEIRTLPTHSVSSDHCLQLYVSIGYEIPVPIELDAEEFSSVWQNNVLRGYTSNILEYHSAADCDIEVQIYFPDVHVALTGLAVK